MVNNKKKFIFGVILFAISLMLFLANKDITTAKYILIWTVVLNGYSLINGRNDWRVIVISGFMLWSNYSVLVANYFIDFNLFFAGWHTVGEVMVVSSNILMIFSLILCLLLPYDEEKESVSFFSDNPDNVVIVVVACLVLFTILIYGFSRPDAAGERGVQSTLYEYSIVIFIIAYYYAEMKWEKIILSVLLMLFAAQNIVYGGRVTALQLIICWFLIFLSHKVTLKKTFPIIFAGVFIFSAVGNFRASFIYDFSVSETINSIRTYKFALDTSFSAFYTSGTFIKVKSIVSDSDRIKLFFRYLLSIVAGGKVQDSNLSVFTRQYYTHYYGGILPFYFYFYMGYAGVVGIGLYTVTVTRKVFGKISIENNRSIFGFFKCASVYLTCTVPRWYLYSSTPLFRGILLLFLVYVICYVVNRL